jgi:hypothetical protein
VKSKMKNPTPYFMIANGAECFILLSIWNTYVQI